MPDSDVLGGVGDGWSVAMSTAGNERGLSLRSPGRFCAAADRLVDLYRVGARPARSADGVVDAWIKAQAYRLYTWGTVTRLADGGDMGAAGSVNKVFWSELDIALHETALDLLGPRRGAGVALAGRLHVLAVRADLRRHQRGAAQHRRRADPRPARERGARADEVRARPRTSATSRTRSSGCWPAPTPSKVARAWADGDHEPGLKLWERLAEQGVTDAGHRGDARGGLASRSRRSGTARRPRALGRVGRLPRRRAGARGRGIATVAVPPHVPYALDADVADAVYVGDTVATGVGTMRGRSTAPGDCSTVDRDGSRRTGDAFDLAVLAASAQLLGAGERILADSVTYVKQRRQFGREIGSLPGDQARAGRRPHRPRLRPAAGLRRRPRRGVGVRRQGRVPPTRRTSPRGPVCRCTARSATPRSST